MHKTIFEVVSWLGTELTSPAGNKYKKVVGVFFPPLTGKSFISLLGK